MRSSKSRSRSKSNRPRSVGNIVNRVFDSSGPEGKVRGTPQQVIDKYLVLARDAQLANDRVAAENFLQHAEHYTRMLAEAQREIASESEARRDGGQEGQGSQGKQRGRDDGGGSGEQQWKQGKGGEKPAEQTSGDGESAKEGGAGGEVIDIDADQSTTGLVDTPEAPAPAEGDSGKKPARRRGTRKPKTDGDAKAGQDEGAKTPEGEQGETAEQRRPAARTRRKAGAKNGEGKSADGDAAAADTSASDSAAE